MEPFIVNTDITDINDLYGRAKSIKILQSCASRKENAGIIGARRFGKTVLRTKADLKLDPMPADERKVMHQEIAKMDHLKTESKGEGKNRYMTISYVD